MHQKLSLLPAFLLFLLSNTAQTLANDNTTYLSIGSGYYDVLDDGNGGAADFRLEYRAGTGFLGLKLKPWAGVEITHDASLWLGGGLLYDAEISPKWHITPSLGAGYYASGSSDHDLGYPLEFRSQLELSYTLDNNDRIALYFSHISNASLGDKNPGTEVIGLYWHQAWD